MSQAAATTAVPASVVNALVETEKCILLPVPNVAQKPKFPSSQLTADQFTAAPALPAVN